MPRIDLGNVQGLVPRLYRYPLSRHLLFRIVDPAAVRHALRELLPGVTTGAQELADWPEPLMNIGLTWNGLVAIGAVLAAARSEFDDIFTKLPAPIIAGDWNGRLQGNDVHLTVHLHCRTDAALSEATSRIRDLAHGCLEELHPVADGDPAITGRSLGGDRLHFGFRDGISQPAVNWDGLPDRPDLINAGHFVLGYYGDKTQTYPQSGTMADLVRDGSYGAFQWIYQDAAGFEAFLDSHASAMAAAADVTDGRELLAGKMMGRWRGGAPLALSPYAPNDAQANAQLFSYRDDPSGQRCPISAHVRIANRRDQPLTQLVAPNFPDGGPYLLRRGMAYGEWLDGPVDDGRDRGLVGFFITADLSHFALVMKWINRTDFSPVFEPNQIDGQDLMMGNRALPSALTEGTIPIQGKPDFHIDHLPSFIRIKGTIMLLLPSLSGLTRIAADPT